MQYRKSSAGVPADPCGQVQGMSLVNDDVMVLRNEARDVGDLDERQRVFRHWSVGWVEGRRDRRYNSFTRTRGRRKHGRRVVHQLRHVQALRSPESRQDRCRVGLQTGEVLSWHLGILTEKPIAQLRTKLPHPIQGPP